MLLKIIFTQPFMCFWVNQVYMFSSQRNIFVSSPRCIFISSPVDFVISQVGFLISLVENLLVGLTPENFWKIYIFPKESSSPHWGTETGCDYHFTESEWPMESEDRIHNKGKNNDNINNIDKIFFPFKNA